MQPWRYTEFTTIHEEKEAIIPLKFFEAIANLRVKNEIINIIVSIWFSITANGTSFYPGEKRQKVCYMKWV